jgi:glutamate-1-semialdehyde 2,1-aminomutase/spore coat polysaccharide biosynthesis protein SpsF
MSESRNLPVSEAWLKRALTLLPNATQTNAKGLDRRVKGQPDFAVHGTGGRFWDPDGREWLDMVMGLGSVILGYRDAGVENAVINQLRLGTLFSVPATLEVEVAEQLLTIFPEYEALRFAKNGSDVTSAAVRLARALTKRDAVITCGYHGWHDWSTSARRDVHGIPEVVRGLTRAFPLEEADRICQEIHRHPGRYAAVVLDPSTHAPLDPLIAATLRDACAHDGVLLVFDEVVSGFRLGLRGYIGHSGVFPDFVCLGKAMGNGVPISALLGRWDNMRALPKTGFTTTFGGDGVGLAACSSTLRQISEPGFYAKLDGMGTRLSRAFTDSLREAGLHGRLVLRGYLSHLRVVSTYGAKDDDLVRRSLSESLARRGVFWMGGCVLCRDHTDEDIKYMAAAFHDALPDLTVSLGEHDSRNEE